MSLPSALGLLTIHLLDFKEALIWESKKMGCSISRAECVLFYVFNFRYSINGFCNKGSMKKIWMKQNCPDFFTEGFIAPLLWLAYMVTIQEGV